MASKIKKKVLDEIQKTKNVFRKAGLEESTKYAVLEGLYNQIYKFDNDQEIINTVWSNRDLPLKMFTVDELEMMPSLNTLMIGEPSTVKVDYDKSFGPDWKENFESIPYNQIALVAMKNGVDEKKLLSDMADEVTKQRRYDIAHGGVQGKVMSVVSPRQQEAIARGEEPSAFDVGGDVAEMALYAVPYGRGASAVIKNPAVRRGVAGTLSNIAPPLTTEAMDAAMYGDENPRGNFSVGDVVAGTSTNVVFPWILRRSGKIGKSFGIDSPLAELAQGQTAKEIIEDKYRSAIPKYDISTSAGREAEANFNKLDPVLQNVLIQKHPIIVKVALTKGKNLEEKATNFLKKNGYDTSKYRVDYDGIVLKNKFKESHVTNDATKAYDYIYGVNGESANSAWRLAGEEALKNILSNKAGDQYAQSNRSLLGKIPLAGNAIQNAIDESEKEKERMKIIKEIREKYGIDLLGGRK